jgi:transcriptional regulator with XRE-family HTH domain
MRKAAAGRLAPQRAADQAKRFGVEVHLARATLGLSQRQIGRRAGVSQSTVERIEGGDPGAQLDTLVAVGAAAGLDLVLNAYPAGRVSLHDTGQMGLAEQIRSVASGAWGVRMEVRAGDHGESADVVLENPRELQHCEIERRAVTFERQYRLALRKREFLAAQDSRPVRLVIVVEDTRRNREALAPHMELIKSQLPASSREILRSFRTGQPLGKDGLLWLRPARPGA